MTRKSKQPSIPTIYDETFRSISYPRPCIASMANCANLIGYLDRHAPTTDVSFSICPINGGEGVFVSEALYNSIPDEHRPPLDTSRADEEIPALMCTVSSVGMTSIPLLLTDADTGAKFRIVLHAIVLKKLLMGMVIGGSFLETSKYSKESVNFTCRFGTEVKHIKGVVPNNSLFR